MNPTRISTAYDELALCAKEKIELGPWRFGQPVVYSAHGAAGPLIRVYAVYSHSTLFELTFHALPSQRTRVDYRRAYDQSGTQHQAWAIIERCGQALPAPSATGATANASSESHAGATQISE